MFFIFFIPPCVTQVRSEHLVHALHFVFIWYTSFYLNLEYTLVCSCFYYTTITFRESLSIFTIPLCTLIMKIFAGLCHKNANCVQAYHFHETRYGLEGYLHNKKCSLKKRMWVVLGMLVFDSTYIQKVFRPLPPAKIWVIIRKRKNLLSPIPS